MGKSLKRELKKSGRRLRKAEKKLVKFTAKFQEAQKKHKQALDGFKKLEHQYLAEKGKKKQAHPSKKAAAVKVAKPKTASVPFPGDTSTGKESPSA